MYDVHISFRLYSGEYNKRTVCVQVKYDKRSVCVCVQVGYSKRTFVYKPDPTSSNCDTVYTRGMP